MLNALKGALLGILGSKKGVAAIAAAATWGVGKLGLHLSGEDVAGLVAPLVGYVIGQGIADHGKEAAVAKATADTASIAAMGDAIVKRIERWSMGGGKTGGDAP